MRDYDDLMGLDSLEDMDAFMTMSMVQDSLVAAGAGAGAILLASWLTPMIPVPAALGLSEVNQHRARAGVGVVAGILIGRGLWNYNRDAAMAVMGGVAGIGLAQLLDSFFGNKLLKGTPLGALPSEGELSANDEALLSAYDNGNMEALAALETTGTSASAPAFQGFADPTVTPEALMGFNGAVTQMETLGYQPYNS